MRNPADWRVCIRETLLSRMEETKMRVLRVCFMALMFTIVVTESAATAQELCLSDGQSCFPGESGRRCFRSAGEAEPSGVCASFGRGCVCTARSTDGIGGCSAVPGIPGDGRSAAQAIPVAITAIGLASLWARRMRRGALKDGQK
jgi:hypothetical protein